MLTSYCKLTRFFCEGVWKKVNVDVKCIYFGALQFEMHARPSTLNTPFGYTESVAMNYPQNSIINDHLYNAF